MPESVNLESHKPPTPNSPNPSEPSTGSIDAHKPDEGEEVADEDRMVVDKHEIQVVEDPEPKTVVRSRPPPAAKVSSALRGGSSKRKKTALNNRAQLMRDKKLKDLLQNFKAIPFGPSQFSDLSKHEELLKQVYLWDFAHIELDRNIRVDLIGQVIANYVPNGRCSHVAGYRVTVSRADLARALHLNHKKLAEERIWPEDFLSFLLDFVSNRMLLHGDMWVVPPQIRTWTDNIKAGHLEKVDWAGLIWFMVEKELGQKTHLTECYYASHLQCLLKFQKPVIFEDEKPEGVEEVLMVKDDDEDTKMEEVLVVNDVDEDTKMEEPSHEEPDSKEQTIQLSLGPEAVARMDNLATAHHDTRDDNGGDDNLRDDNAGDMDEKAGNQNPGSNGNVDNTIGSRDECIEKLTTDVEDTEKLMTDAEDTDHDAGGVGNVEGTGHDAGDVRNTEGSDDDPGDVGNVAGTDHVEGIDPVQSEEDRGAEVMNLEQPRVDEQNHWFSLDKSNEDENSLHPCSSMRSKAHADVAYEQAERDPNIGEQLDVEDDDVEVDEHAKQFETLQKCDSFSGLPSGNFMQPLESSQMVFTSSDFGSHPSLDLLSHRVENQVMLGGPSMLRNGNKRSIEHESDMSDYGLNNNSHATANDSNKRLRTEGPWDPKGVPDFESCIDHVNEWLAKARLAHVSTTERALQQASINQEYLMNELANKERVIQQLRSNLEEFQRIRRAEVIRFDNELSVMGSLIDGYRRALKDTQKAFSDYRKRVVVSEEPLYKDAGEGGVVKSVLELEKERLAREEEERLVRIMLADWEKRMENEWDMRCEGYLERIEVLGVKLQDLVQEMGLLSERFRMSKGGKKSVEKSAGSEDNGEAAGDMEMDLEAAGDEEMAVGAALNKELAGEAAKQMTAESGGDDRIGVEVGLEEKEEITAGGEAASNEKTGVATEDEAGCGEKTGDEAACGENIGV